MSDFVFNPLKLVYLTFVVVRMSTIMMLQIVYTHLFKMTKDQPENFRIKELTQTVYNVLIYLGATLRSLNGAGAFAYAFYVYLLLIFYTATPFYYAKHLKLNEISLFALMKDLDTARDRTRGELRECMQSVTQSSENYELNCANQNWYESSLECESVRKAPIHKAQRFSQAQIMSRLETMRLTRRERLQLNNMIDSKTCYRLVWPKTRTEKWRQTIQKFTFRIYLAASIVFWFGGHFATVWGQFLAYRLNETNELMPKSWRHFTRLDLVTLIEQHFLVWVIYELFTYPLALALAIIWDHLEFLAHLKARFRLYLTTSSYPFNCDQEALAMYLNLIYYRKDLQPSLKFVSVVLSQYITFAMAITLTILSYIKSIKSHELKIIVFLALLDVLAVNVIFTTSAYLSAQSVHIIKPIWSLIGSSAAAALHSHNGASAEILPARRPISRHTLLLWRRLVVDQDTLVDGFTCRVYGGLFKVNFTAVLRINFVCASAVIFVLTM